MQAPPPAFGTVSSRLAGHLFTFGYEGKEAEPPTCHVGTLAGASPVVTATLDRSASS